MLDVRRWSSLLLFDLVLFDLKNWAIRSLSSFVCDSKSQLAKESGKLRYNL